MLLAPLTALAALVVAAPATAQAPTLAPQVATGGQPFPAHLAGWTESLTGKALRTVPHGWTVSTWTFDLAAGASATLDLACPRGTAIATIGPDGTRDPAPVTVTLTPGDYVPFYGSKGPTVTATASQGQPGTGSFMTVCMPSVKARTRIVRGHAPVTFPDSDEGLGLKKGAAIPHTWRLYKSVVRKVGRSGAVGNVPRASCPRNTVQNEYAIDVPGPRGQTLPGGGFTLPPSAKWGKGPVTVYTLCSSLNE
jgi:hypothetical protein